MKRIGFIDGRRIAGWSFPATAVPGPGQVQTIVDQSTGVRFNRGLFIDYRQTGIKTGAGRVDGLGVDMIVSADSPYANTMAHYVSFVGTPTVGYATGGYWYLNNPGAGNLLNHYCGLMLGIDVTNPPAGRSAFMRVFGHGGAVDAVIWLANAGGAMITNLLYFEGGVSPWVAGAVGGAQDQKIRVSVGGVARYIPLHAT